MLSSKRVWFPIGVILAYIPLYVACPLIYRHIEESMDERGMSVDQSTLDRWAIHFLFLIEKLSRKHKRPGGRSWRMEETYIKVMGGLEGFWCKLWMRRS
jgi:putative transposase